MLTLSKTTSMAIAAVACATFFCSVHRVGAGVIATYTDRSAFESDGTGLLTETFNLFKSDTTFHETTLDIGDFTLHSSGNTLDPVRRNKIDVPVLEYGLFNINGSTIANVSLNPGGLMTMTFDHAITTFGADFADLNNSLIRTVILVDGETLTPAVAPRSQPRFYGFVSDTPFSTIQFRGVVGTDGDGFGIDDVTHGGSILCAIVPEPSSLLGFAALSMIAGGTRRRRNR